MELREIHKWKRVHGAIFNSANDDFGNTTRTFAAEVAKHGRRRAMRERVSFCRHNPAREKSVFLPGAACH
jgi:hypothetical protein